MTNKIIINSFNLALEIAKSYGINFISVSTAYDGCIEIKNLSFYQLGIETKLLANETKILEDWQVKELFKNCLSWIAEFIEKNKYKE